MVKVLAQEMKTVHVGVKNFTVHTCTLLTLLGAVHNIFLPCIESL